MLKSDARIKVAWKQDQDSHAVSLFSDFVVEISTLSTKDQYGEVAGDGRPHSR